MPDFSKHHIIFGEGIKIIKRVQNSNPPYKPNPALPIAEQTAEELKEHNRKLETHIYSALGIKAE